jgi:hypothetical protein
MEPVTPRLAAEETMKRMVQDEPEVAHDAEAAASTEVSRRWRRT